MKEKFIEFVKNNPKLINYIKEKNGTWQELFEIYTIYGEDEKIWNKYILENDKGINELINMIKNINLDGVKTTIDGLQKAISILQNISKKEDTNNETYEKTEKYNNLDD